MIILCPECREPMELWYKGSLITTYTCKCLEDEERVSLLTLGNGRKYFTAFGDTIYYYLRKIYRRLTA